MNAFLYLLQFPWVEPLGWTLIHFLWQGALIGLGARIGLRAAHGKSPNLRYLIACGTMLACVAAVFFTFAALASPLQPRPAEVHVLTNARISSPAASDFSAPASIKNTGTLGASPGGAGAAQPQDSEGNAGETARTSIFARMGNEAVRWAVPLWLAGMLFLGLRLCCAWFRVQRWRFHAASLSNGPAFDAFARLLGRMRIGRRVRLLFCDAASGPMTLGWLKPAILLPAQVVTGLSPEELEAILAHELAHIRRHDYLANLIQSVVEIALFYHPVVWWISREIRETREECCDAMAAGACADPLRVAQALSSLAGLRAPPRPALAAKGGSLLTRVSRLLGRARPEPFLSSQNAAWTLTLACAALIAMGIVHSAKLIAKSAEEPANSKPAPRGIVIDETGAPVAQARVLLYHAVNGWGLGNQVVEEVRSDAAGRFAFAKPMPFVVPQGSLDTDHYTLFAFREGKAPAWAQIVGSGGEPRDYALTVSKPVSQSYEVVDKDGKPVAGATVWLRSAAKQENRQPIFHDVFELPEDIGVCSAVTDAGGRATLADLPNTDRSVAASKPGFEDSLSTTAPREGVPRFVLRPAATLEGRVTDSLGAPVAGAKVWLYPKFRWHQFFLGRTDEHGFYRIGKIWSNGNTPDWGSYDAGIEHPLFATVKRSVAFTPGQAITGFNFTAAPGTEIVGTLLDPVTRKPVPDAKLCVDSACGRQTVFSDVRGEFRSRVIPGDVSVIFLGPPAGRYVLGLHDLTKVRAFGDEFPLTVFAPSALGDLGAVRGRAIDPDGRPMIGARLTVTIPGAIVGRKGWRGNSWAGAPSADDGSFEIDRMPIGLRFSFCVESRGGKLAGLVSGEMKGARMELNAPVVARPTTSAEALVIGLDHQPRRNLAVQVSAIVEGQLLRSQNLKTDAEGVLRVPDAISGLRYNIAQTDSRYASAAAELAPDGARAERQTVILSDRYLVRLEGLGGERLPIRSFKNFFVWILDEGKPIQWTNGPLKILGRQDGDVIVPRETLVLGKAGNKVDFLIEMEDGAIVKAEGVLPADGALIVVKATESAAVSAAQPDPSVARRRRMDLPAGSSVPEDSR